ncbi:hypothetical protein AAH994_14395 [Weeksellaceae bacterium A-14]
MKNYYSVKLLSLILILTLTNCKKNEKVEVENIGVEQISNNDPKAYEIKGKNIFLREGPGTKYKKLINQKATEIIGETQFMEVDNSCTVSIEEEKDGWAKIRVVDPPHLTATHSGWIPLKSIIKGEEQITNIDLSKLKYEIIKTSENNVSKNYNIYLEIKNLSKDEIISFIKQFREKNCNSCTISIFDNKSIKNLIDKYPLNKNEYLKFADHFVAWSTFDSPKSVSFYPFQDSKYTEYGGKNFKEEKMK